MGRLKQFIDRSNGKFQNNGVTLIIGKEGKWIEIQLSDEEDDIQ